MTVKRFAIRIQYKSELGRKPPVGNSAVPSRHGQCGIVLPDVMASHSYPKVEIKGTWYWAKNLDSSHGTIKDKESETKLQVVNGSQKSKT
jgi:hypothetical protein